MEITLNTAQVTDLMQLVLEKLVFAVDESDDMEYAHWFAILLALVKAD